MVALLLLVTFVIAFLVATLVVVIFTKPISRIMERVVPGEISSAWTRYLQFAVYVVGIGGGVRIWDFEKYMTLVEPYHQIVPLTPNRWLLEIYQTVIGTLQSTAMVLLFFFLVSLIAIVIVRAYELRTPKGDAGKAA